MTPATGITTYTEGRAPPVVWVQIYKTGSLRRDYVCECMCDWNALERMKDSGKDLLEMVSCLGNFSY